MFLEMTLEDFFAAAEIAEGADVGDDESDAELIFGSDLAEVDAAVFDGEAAAASVVTGLHDLALQRFVGEVVARAPRAIEAFAVFVAVAFERGTMVGKQMLVRLCRRLQECEI